MAVPSRSPWAPRGYAPAVAGTDDVVLQVRLSNLSWREVDGEVIALDLDSSTYFSANRTGSLLWHAMVDGATISELVVLLQESFDIEEQTARTDVTAFLQLLHQNGLLGRGG